MPSLLWFVALPTPVRTLHPHAGPQVYVRLRPGVVPGVVASANAEGCAEAIQATSDVELTLEPPQNAKRCAVQAGRVCGSLHVMVHVLRAQPSLPPAWAQHPCRPRSRALTGAKAGVGAQGSAGVGAPSPPPTPPCTLQGAQGAGA